MKSSWDIFSVICFLFVCSAFFFAVSAVSLIKFPPALSCFPECYGSSRALGVAKKIVVENIRYRKFAFLIRWFRVFLFCLLLWFLTKKIVVENIKYRKFAFSSGSFVYSYLSVVMVTYELLVWRRKLVVEYMY